ncbi:MAG: hypothetical protein Q9216_003478 [Gyalolechia sp. 2 TL-2023]
MDHVPYPLTSDLPGLEIPFLCESRLIGTPGGTQPGEDGASRYNIDSYLISQHGDCTAPIEQGSQDSRAIELEAGGQTTGETLNVQQWTAGFWEYPEKQGWVTGISGPRWYHCSSEVAAARAQEWLYFQLLDSFLGFHVNTHSISRRSTTNGRTILDTSMLPELLQDWELRLQSNRLMQPRSEDERAMFTESDDVLKLLIGVLQTSTTLDEQTEPSRSISWSIKILVEALAKAVWRVSNDSTSEQWRIWKLGPTPILIDRMANAGWCRFQIARLWYQYLPSTMYYLSSLPKRTTFGAVTHDSCTADHCTSTGVDPITYEPQHQRTCLSAAASYNSCAMVDVDTASIADVILQDSFPLIEIQARAGGEIELKIHKYTVGMPFVALSHVWSGGMGNVSQNSMRLCQLIYLHSLLRRIRENGDDDLDRGYGSRKIDDEINNVRVRLGFARKDIPLLLWIDTLCVPVGSEHKAAYTMTLRRMAQIYVAAQCVLVLDPELQHLTHRAMQKEQVFAHILCSAWMSRSWCFQEASLARVYLVQFKDGYFVVDQQYFEFQKDSGQLDRATNSDRAIPQKRSAETRTLASQTSLMQEISCWFWEMPVVMKIRNRDPRQLMNKLEDWKNFALAWNGLRSRSTTKPEDLYGILAVVVDLSAGDVLKLHQQDRMKAIYRSQTTLPLSLLYQVCPKIPDINGRDTWAPSVIKGDRLDLHTGYCTVSLEGLLINPNWKANLSPPQAILVTCPLNFGRFLDIEIRETHTRRVIEFLVGQTCPMPHKSGHTLCCMYDDSLLRHVPGTGTFSPGVCLLINSQVDHILYAAYVCPIRVFSSETSTSVILGSLGQELNLNSVGQCLDWQKHSILIKSGSTHWPSPLQHVSKRALSNRVIIRNSSNWIDLSSVGLVSGPYMVGIIICGIYRQNQLPGKLLWLCVSRWLSLLVEAAWALASLGQWDRHRTIDWTDRLYGTTAKPRIQRVKHLSQHPAFIARLPPLAAASTFIGLYHARQGYRWMKVFAIVLFAEVGLHLAFTLFVLCFIFLNAAHGWYEPATRKFFSDLPEDPVEATAQQVQTQEVRWPPDVDHRYKVAIVAWRIIDFLRRKKGTRANFDRKTSLA